MFFAHRDEFQTQAGAWQCVADNRPCVDLAFLDKKVQSGLGIGGKKFGGFQEKSSGAQVSYA